MGDHYVPREHLRRFAADADETFVWMCDKKLRTYKKAGISAVANEVDYYPDEVEKEFANNVEGKAAEIARKIQRKDELTRDERVKFSFYMFTMATRGPRRRRILKEKAPAIMKDTFEEARSKVSNEADNASAPKVLSHLDDLEAAFSQQWPSELVDLLHTPFSSFRTVNAVFNMTWNICSAPAGARFVTSDTPAHYFESLGVGRPESEFTFPISTTCALIGQHLGIDKVIYRNIDARTVRHVNRRVLSHAERFAFSAKEELWLDDVMQKSSHQEQLIKWK